jgi:hypothetical protein
MENNSKLTIDELSIILTQILSKFKENKGNEINLRNDFYWHISVDELYNPYASPQNLTLGQLSDDLLEVSRLTNDIESAIPYDLTRISNILKALSSENALI